MKKKSLIWIACGVVSIGIATTVIAIETSDIAVASRRLKSEQVLARSEGLFLTEGELAKATSVPAKQDAFPVLQTLAADLAAVHVDSDALAIYKAHPTKVELDTTAHELTRHANLFADLKQLDSRPHADYLRWGHLIDQRVDMITMRDVARLLAADATVAIHSHQVDRAARDFERSFQMCSLANDHPSLTGLLTSTLLQEITALDLRYAIEASYETPGALERFEGVLRQAPAAKKPWMVLNGELVSSMESIEDLRKYGPFTSPNVDIEPLRTQQQPWARFPILYDAYEARMIEASRILARQIGDSDGLEAAKIADRFAKSPLLKSGPSYEYANFVYGGVFAQAFGVTYPAVEAQKRLCQEEIALLKVRRQTGTFPEALPIKLADPYGGKPLRYRIEGSGFRLWSVGQDLKDDGGRESDPSLQGKTDIAITFPAHDTPSPKAARARGRSKTPGSSP